MKALLITFIDNEKFFNGFKPYGDNIVEEISKFVFFSKAALSILPVIDFRPDVIHCHDWQTGILPVYFKRASLCRRRVLPWNQVCYDDS